LELLLLLTPLPALRPKLNFHLDGFLATTLGAITDEDEMEEETDNEGTGGIGGMGGGNVDEGDGLTDDSLGT
jgi:hypothetical protein